MTCYDMEQKSSIPSLLSRHLHNSPLTRDILLNNNILYHKVMEILEIPPNFEGQESLGFPFNLNHRVRPILRDMGGCVRMSTVPQYGKAGLQRFSCQVRIRSARRIWRGTSIYATVEEKRTSASSEKSLLANQRWPTFFPLSAVRFLNK